MCEQNRVEQSVELFVCLFVFVSSRRNENEMKMKTSRGMYRVLYVETVDKDVARRQHGIHGLAIGYWLFIDYWLLAIDSIDYWL